MRLALALTGAACAAVALGAENLAELHEKEGAPADHGDTDAGGGDKSEGLGYICALIAVIGFGSYFTIIKSYAPGDGMMFQFCMCCGIFFTGIIYHLAVDCPAFQPVAMLGGFLWCTGNFISIVIVILIGMGLGQSLWNSCNMLVGWITAHFGLFGLDKQTVTHDGLNVAGACIAVVAVLVFAQVKPAPKKNVDDAADDAEVRPLTEEDDEPAKKDGKLVLVGALMAVVAGLFMGSWATPLQNYSDHIAKNHCGWNDDGQQIFGKAECEAVLKDKGRTYCHWDGSADPGKKCGGPPQKDMVFSQFTGIFLTSFVYFVVYERMKWAQWKRAGGGQSVQAVQVNEKKPSQIANEWLSMSYMFANVSLIVPGFICGIGWAIPQICWFYANDNLSMSISFPIICTGPAVVGNIWGYFVFKEIDTSPLNTAKLIGGLLLVVLVGILIALSN